MPTAGARPPLPAALARLARAYGVLTHYRDGLGQERFASAPALVAVLAASGAPIARPEDAGAALRARRAADAATWIEPVLLAWDGALDGADVRLPAAAAEGPLAVTLELESGERRVLPAALESSRARRLDGQRLQAGRLRLDLRLPLGYHRLRLEARGASASCQVLAAPTAADASALAGRHWGVFVPTFALRAQNDWGCGNLSSLLRLLEWLATRGASLLATLPLLPTFLDEVPFDSSPYAPVTRSAWNELFADLEREPEWSAPAVQRLVSAPSWQAERERLRREPLLDYRGQGRLRAPILEAMAAAAFDAAGGRRPVLERFLAERPQLRDYARFRGAVTARRAAWPTWPERMRAGELREQDVLPAAFQAHAYGQFVAHEQLARVAAEGRRRGVHLLLDLPLGVHSDSYDTWRHARLFAPSVSTGAPPDRLFTGGQDWGFPPPLAAAQRDEGWRDLALVVRHHLEHARVLRVDHVLGLHRLFWIPRGMPATEGVYVRRPAEEQYAVLCLESARAQATIVGEDLGTLAPGVRQALARHDIQRLHVLPFAELREGEGPEPPPRACVAALNTHDLPTFAGFRAGADIDDRLALGLLDAEAAVTERLARQQHLAALSAAFARRGLLPPGGDGRALLAAAHAHLAESPAAAVLVTLEDLWGEARPVNVPGTHHERPNWRRPLARVLEDILGDDEIRRALADVDRRRRGHA